MKSKNKDVVVETGAEGVTIEEKPRSEAAEAFSVNPLIAGSEPFLDEVLATSGGETVRLCAQCGMCSSSCPNVKQMDYSPRKTIALIRSGERYEVLSANTMWICASCYMCTARCPRGVKITDLMHALERLSFQGNFQGGKKTALMYRAFVESIRNNGLICEFSMMMKFYIGAIFARQINPFTLLQMAPIGFKLYTRKRMAPKPEKIKGHKQLKAILDKAKSLGDSR